MEAPRILIADQTEYRQAMIKVLEEAGYLVTSMTSIKSLPDEIRALQPCLILLDWELAKQNDRKLISELHNSVNTENVPIVITIDEMNQFTDFYSFFQQGIYDFIKKPIDKLEFLARVTATLQVNNTYNELIESNKAKSRLLAVVSHDLRSPLSSLQSLITHVKAHGKEDLCMKQIYRLVDDLDEEFSAVMNMTNSLLFWALDQEDGICMEREESNISSLIVQTLKVYSSQIKEKNLDIRFHISEELKVFSDSNMLSFILRNLLSNAFKFTPRGGRVNVTASEYNNYVKITVTDSGMGISQKTLNNLFQLIKTSNSTVDAYGKKGTGLGLAVAYDFAKKMGGALSVRSKKDTGTTFTLTLPVSKVNNQEEEKVYLEKTV